MGAFTEEELKQLEDFWVYCAPVRHYHDLKVKRPAFMLRRNLCHAQRPVAKDPAYATLQVAVHNAKTQRISILLALCRNGGDKSEDFAPLASAVVHLPAAPATNGSTAGQEATEDAYSDPVHVTLSIPWEAGKAAASTSGLTLLCLEWGEHGDLAHLRRGRGAGGTKVLAPTLLQGRACGVLPAGEPVQCCQVPVNAAAFQHQENRAFQALLQPFIFRIPRRKDATGALVCTFDPHDDDFEMTQTSLKVEVQVKLSGDSGSPPVVAKADSEQRAVYYHYHYHRDFERHLVEKRSGNICAFCLLACCSFRGLKQHLKANHGLFAFGFSPDHPDVVPAVNVYCLPDLHDSEGRPAKAPALLPGEAQSYKYFSQRYRPRPLPQPPTPPPLPEHAVYGSHDVEMLDADNDRGESDVAADRWPRTINASAATSRSGARAMRLPRPLEQMASEATHAAFRPEKCYYHSRTCIPMTREEADAAPDSDDEDVDTGWEAKFRKKLKATPGLSEHEAEFILNWNKFAERVPIFGSGMFLPGRVRRFFEQHAQVLGASETLRRCCHAFLMELWDHAVIESEDVDHLLRRLAEHTPA